VDEALTVARAAARPREKQPRANGTIALDATIHVVHGKDRIASTEDGGIEGLCGAFEAWIGRITHVDA